MATSTSTPPIELALCTWVMAADRVVWGEVVDLELLSNPAVQFTKDENPGWTTIDPSSCRRLSPALRMSIQVLRNLFGEGDDDVDVHFGKRHIDYFVPHPSVDEAGNLVWHGPVQGGLYPGDQVGVLVRFVEKAGIWSAMGEPLFAVDDEGRLYAQNLLILINSVLVPPLEGITLEELAVAIDSCGDGDASAIQDRQWRVGRRWGPENMPSLWGAAECVDGYAPEDPGESSDNPGESSDNPGSGEAGYEVCLGESCDGGELGAPCRADGPHCADGLQCLIPDGESEGVCQLP